MTDAEFQKLLKRDSYQIFLFTSPACVPFSVAIHPWFVINRMGVISRWEINHGRHVGENIWGHLSCNLLPPTVGMQIIPYIAGPTWGSTLCGQISGDAGSVADKMSAFIEQSPTAYKYNEYYRLWGPNSNTYAQWVLNKFPESGMKLSWRAIGKNFR